MPKDSLVFVIGQVLVAIVGRRSGRTERSMIFGYSIVGIVIIVVARLDRQRWIVVDFVAREEIARFFGFACTAGRVDATAGLGFARRCAVIVQVKEQMSVDVLRHLRDRPVKSGLARD